MSHTDTSRNILHFDCFSGVAGDMILASLLDMGLPLHVVESAVSKLPLSGFRIRTEKEKRQTIMATRFFVDVDEAHQPHRHFGDIRRMIEGANLHPDIQALAIDIFEILARAEARVHGTTVERVHFHEVGAVDSIVDIVGAAAALHHLDARITASALPLGNGFVNTAHGSLPVPAPATLFILEGVPVTGTEVEAELTTPTGAAILKRTVDAFGRFPDMIPESVGFGAGARSHPTRPGLLRAVLGRPSAKRTETAGSTTLVVEANIDDMTGEVAAHVKNALFPAGALDVWFESIQMKKGRPALKIGVLCRESDLGLVADTLFRESSTIGLRYYPVGRIEMSRTIQSIDTPFGPIRIKVSTSDSGEKNAAPEFDDCLAAADKHQVPVKRVLATAMGLAQDLVSSK